MIHRIFSATPRFDSARSAVARIASAAMFALSLTSCGSDGSSSGPTEPGQPVQGAASVITTISRSTLHVGESAHAAAVVRDVNGTTISGAAVAWSSSDVGVATVSSAGDVVGTGVGSASITAASGERSSSLNVIVTAAPIASVTVTLANASLHVGDSTLATAHVLDVNGVAVDAPAIIWSSVNTVTASVSTTGIVVAKGVGATTITATVRGVVGSLSVTTLPASVATVQVTPPKSTININERLPLFASAADRSGAPLFGRTTSWSTSDSAIATVNASGVVTGHSAGTATIVATVDAKSAGVAITVHAQVSSISVGFSESTIPVGSTAQASSTLRDPNNAAIEQRPVSWFSMTPTVASVDANGLVTALSPGTATIQAVAEGIVGTAAIVVVPAPVASVQATASKSTINIGEALVLIATPLDAGGRILTGRSTTWSSSDPAIASVSSGGVVTGHAGGPATITATIEGKVGTITINVHAQIQSITVSLGATSVAAGSTTQASATLRDPNGLVLGTRLAGWLSSAPSVATVDANGLVTAVGVGTATIQATAEGVFGSATLTVTPGPVATVQVSAGKSTININETLTLVATPLDARGNVLAGRATSWSSSAPAIAGISAGGVVTGHAAGTATLSATIDGKSGTVTITVHAQLASISVAVANDTLLVGATTQASAVLRDPNGAALPPRTVFWFSGSTVASVDQNGVVTALSPGRATIQATIDGFFGSAVVTVVAPDPTTGIRVTMTSPVATNEFILAVDGGAFGSTPQVTHLTGSNMTSGSLVVGVPAGGPYRVRVVAVDPRTSYGTFPLMNATGKVESVSVASGAVTAAAVSLSAPSVVVSAPTSVGAGSSITILWTLQDAGASIDRPFNDARVYYGTTPPIGYDMTGSQAQASCTPQSGTTRQCTATITAPLTTGTIYLQVVHETFDITMPGSSRAGWLIQPSVERGETAIAITVR